MRKRYYVVESNVNLLNIFMWNSANVLFFKGKCVEVKVCNKKPQNSL